MTSHIAPGSHSLGTYINVADADAAMAWYQENLNAEIRSRLAMPDGGVMHAEIVVEGTLLMLTTANPEWGTAAPGELSTYTLCLYVPDCDAVFARCIEAGAEELQPMIDQMWGDRAGKLCDPFGVSWMIMTHKEDVPDEEIEARFAAMMAEGGEQ